jgi:serine/threonine-protein kinase
MALAAGTKLGPYEIVAPIGAGGMGEVYRARDTKLDRDVAIKVLPAAVAHDPERLARFEREAKVLAALNHPNIAQIYGVEQDALVMELVEGETLPCPLPIETALPHAKQIAEALEYAHERGVVHRDLKPANIKVTPEGTVKLLDFGLAKAIEDPVRSGDDPSNSPTLTLGATRMGMILGTAAYMSPEQAGGKTVDRRADIWSFGAVLYEMLTGKKAFPGESVSDTLATVLKVDPDWKALPAATPASVRSLVRRCLTKDPKQRLQAVGEARIVLQAPGGTDGPPQTGVHPSKLSWVVAACLAVIAAALAWTTWRTTRLVERPLMQFNAELGRDIAPIGSGWGSQVALSPDGRMLVAPVRDTDGKRRLGIRRLDQNQVTTLPGTEDAYAPFFSPDSRWIAFDVRGQLKKVSPQGGVAVTICNPCLGGSWGDDDGVVTMPGVGAGLLRVSANGGTPALITKLDTSKQERAHRWPQVLPGSEVVLFTVYDTTRDPDDSEIDVVSVKTGMRKTVYRGGTYARYLPSGHLVFVHQNTLFAASFDLKRLELESAPQPILEDIRNGADEGADFGFSQTGTLVALSNKGALKRSILWLDGAGRTQPLQMTPALYSIPRFSPDGKHLGFSLDDGQGHTDIWVRDPERDTTRRLTSMPGRNVGPVWVPDGSIIFASSNPAAPGIYWMHSDGSGEPERLTDGATVLNPGTVSPDGKWLAALRAAEAPDNGGAIWMVPIEAEAGHPRLGKPELFLSSAIFPVFSPDGRWVAYYRQAIGQQGVWVRPFRGPGGPWLVDSDGGYPVWPRNGHQLFYVSVSSRRMMAAGYAVNGNTFVPDKPQAWADKPLLPSLVPVTSTYDVTPDGKRFAVVLYEDGTAEEKPILHVTLVLNFFDELRRRVSVSK